MWKIGVPMVALLIAVASLASAQGNADRGKVLFATYCATCHGDAGAGDGPAASALNPKPRNLAEKGYIATRPDGDLLKVIKEGGPALGKSPLMAPFGGALKDGDIHDLVTFIRTLAK